MILMCISPLLFMDEISIQNSSKCVHFLTHLNDSIFVPSDWNSVIYTSSYIKKLLLHKIPEKFFRIILPNERVSITLCDGKSFDVIMFESDGFTRNVMFYFHRKDPRKTLIYTGPFARYRSILVNKKFSECVLSGIDRLYIDNTRVNSTDNQTIENVGKTIEDIIIKYPGYQIFMNTPVFGFEDLIFSLANDFKFKIFAGTPQMHMNLKNIFVRQMSDATIIIGNEPSTEEQEKKKVFRRFLRKTITLRFIEADYSINNNAFEEIGLYQISWWPHASPFDLYSFIAFVEPYEVCRIFKDMPKFPKFLLELQKNAISEDDDVIDVVPITVTIKPSESSDISIPDRQSTSKSSIDSNLALDLSIPDRILAWMSSMSSIDLNLGQNSITEPSNLRNDGQDKTFEHDNPEPASKQSGRKQALDLSIPDSILASTSSMSSIDFDIALDLSIPDSILGSMSSMSSMSSIDFNLGENSITEPSNLRNDGQDKAFENDNPEPVIEIELVELSGNGEDVLESNSPVKAGRRNSYLQSPRKPLFPPVPSSPCSVISISSTSIISGTRKRRRRTNSNSKRKQPKFPGASKHSGRKQTESPRASTHSNNDFVIHRENNIAMNLKEVCRACLCTGRIMYSLVQSISPKINLPSAPVVDLCNIFTNVLISNNNRFPDKICVQCLEVIQQTYSLMEKCERSEGVLKKLKNVKVYIKRLNINSDL